MEVQQIIENLDQEIARLKEARALLAGDSIGKRKRGRPPKAAASRTTRTARTARKSGLTAAGRRRISEALKRRWAAHRKAQAKSEKAA